MRMILLANGFEFEFCSYKNVEEFRNPEQSVSRKKLASQLDQCFPRELRLVFKVCSGLFPDS